MPKVDWPPAGSAAISASASNGSTARSRATGAAKYSYDINRPGMLYAKLVTSPHAKAQGDEHRTERRQGAQGR